MFEHLIFDCDGVLVDTEIVAAEVVCRVMNQYGGDISLDNYLTNCTGKQISVILNSLPEQHTKDVDLHQLMINCEEEIYEQLRPVEGMPAIVHELPLPKSVVSNSALWQVKKAIAHVKLEDVFEGRYFSAQMVKHPKPAPDVYIHASRTLDVSPEKCLVVEDSKAGVTAAVAAGMHVIGFVGASHILPGHAEALLEIGAKSVASNYKELKQIIIDLVK